jgi:hypothetical protein
MVADEGVRNIGTAPDGGVFIGTTHGWSGDVLYSANGINSWYERNSGLKMTNVQAFSFAAQGQPFAGTYGTGVYRRFIPKMEGFSFQDLPVTVAAPFFFEDKFFCIPASLPGVPPGCPGDPECPKCDFFNDLNSFSGPHKEVLRRMSRDLAIASRDSSKSSEALMRLARTARSAPLGMHYSAARRARLVEIGRRKEFTAPVRHAILEAMNAIALDSRLPKERTKRVATHGRVEFGELFAVTLPPSSRSGTLILSSVDSIPTTVPVGYTPTWPVGAYSLMYSGTMESNDLAELTASLRGLKVRHGSDVRLIQLTDGKFRDITREVDWRRGVVIGSTNRLGRYYLMEKTGPGP